MLDALPPTEIRSVSLPPVNILLVDDEPKNLTALDAVLAAPDRNLVNATGGAEALRHLLHDDFAVILLDVHMPGMDGFETAELIRGRERSRDTPIIFLTAATRGEPFISRGYSVGAVDYIVKPFDPDILRSKVAVFVELFSKTEQVKRHAEEQARFLEERARFLEERAARTEAEAARDRLQQVVDVFPEAITIADADGRIVLSNATAGEIMGRLPGQVDHAATDGVDLLKLDGSPYPPDEVPLARVVLRGKVVRGEQLLIVNALTGEHRPVLVNGAPLRDVGGAVVGAVLVFQDISPIKDLERQKDEFLAATSHDLKSPLTAIKMRAQLLQRRAAGLESPEAEAIAEGLVAIDKATSRLTSTIDALLDVACLQMDRPLDLDRGPTNLGEVARQVAADLQAGTERHEIRVVGEDQLVGNWDRARLERVITNLIGNAIKYSPNGGPVTLTLERDGEDWGTLHVCDEGLGIPSTELPRIFERFYRGSNVATKIEGTGIGLAGAYQIVAQHGGTLTAESREGEGSTFTLRLPLEPTDTT